MRFMHHAHPGVDVTLTVRGDIASRGPIKVLPGGSVIGSVTGRKIVVQGMVQGKLKTADKIELQSSAIVRGEMQASSISTEAGARFEGRCKIGKDVEPQLAPTVEETPAPAAPNRNRWFWQK